MDETLGIVGSGAIATGLAATAARHGEIKLYARSEESAAKARKRIDRICSKLEDVDEANVHVVTDFGDLSGCSAVIEAVVEEHDAKAAILAEVVGGRRADADRDDDVVAVGHQAGRGARRRRALRRPARLQPGPEDEARRARLRA